MIGEFVYINGDLVPHAEAKISVFDHNFVYGDGVFEGLQAVNGGIFRLADHVERLYRSARFLSIEIPLTPAQMISAILGTARRNRMRDGYVRPMISRGVGPMGVRNMHKLGPPTIVIVAQHEEVAGGKDTTSKGIRAHVASIRRIPPECLDSRVKSCNYVNNIMAYLEAQAAGCDTAVMLDMQGYVAEGYGNNICAVERGSLVTPPIGNILAGITRAAVIELAQKQGIPVVERAMTVYDLVCADEVFETATMAEIVPIAEIDGRKVGDGGVGPVTKRLHADLRRLMASGEQSAPIYNS
jgi:branched-chain amino acid aminotransferase